MNVGKQIQNLRKQHQMSQEALAEKIFVSRQTISNWENERSYPDIHNLLMLSVLFDVSLDELVKGDVKMMKKKIQENRFTNWTYSMLAFMLLAPLSIAPAMDYFGNNGLIIPAVFFIVAMISAWMVEKYKKENNLKTYSQIVAYTEGKPIDEIKPGKKDVFVKVGSVIASALISLFLVWLGFQLF